MAIKEKAQITVYEKDQETLKKTDELYQDNLAFLEAGENSYIKTKMYKTFVPSEIHSFRTRPVICIIDNGAGPRLIGMDFLDEGWLDNICQRDMPQIHSASDMKLVVPGTITFHLSMGESDTPVTFGNVGKVAILVLLWKTFIERFKKLIHPAARKFILTTPRQYLF